MPKLTDSQLVILSAAAGRNDGSVLPLPKSLKLNKAAAARVLNSLLNRELLVERPAKGETAWREADDGQPMGLAITAAGLEAIGAGSGANVAAAPAKPSRRAKRGKSSPDIATLAPKALARRAGTKQALLVGMLRRKRGASIPEIVAATGWQPHTVRGAISGALKKKLGLAVASEKVEGRGRVYRIADTD